MLSAGFLLDIPRKYAVDFFRIRQSHEIFSIRIFFILHSLHQQDAIFIPQAVTIGNQDDVILVVQHKPVSEFTFDAGSVFSLEENGFFFLVHCLTSDTGSDPAVCLQYSMLQDSNRKQQTTSMFPRPVPVRGILPSSCDQPAGRPPGVMTRSMQASVRMAVIPGNSCMVYPADD